MSAAIDGSGRLPAAFLTPGSSSFTEFLGEQAPGMLPGRRQLPPGMSAPDVPHGTTIVALTFDGGVVLAGDRRATAANLIASRDVRKVYPADGFSAVGIAGVAGLAVELVRLFQMELEHYEKIEGEVMSTQGKANRLGTMIRSQLGLAMQGLAVLPLFVGYDVDRERGRIFSYDVTGGHQEEHDHHTIGSGSVFARGSMKKLWHEGLTQAQALRVAVEALFDAADDDSATGGPDMQRQIWPVLTAITGAGYREVPDPEAGDIARVVVDARVGNPGGNPAGRSGRGGDVR